MLSNLAASADVNRGSNCGSCCSVSASSIIISTSCPGDGHTSRWRSNRVVRSSILKYTFQYNATDDIVFMQGQRLYGEEVFCWLQSPPPTPYKKQKPLREHVDVDALRIREPKTLWVGWTDTN